MTAMSDASSPRRWAPVATISTVMLVAAAAAAASAWYRMQLSQRPVEFLGREPARLLLLAPRATLRHTPAAVPHGTASLPAAQGEVDVSQAPGFSHVRRCLLSDRSYDWGAAIDPATATWSWQLVLREDAKELRLDFDLERGWVRVVDSNRSAAIPAARGALATLFGEVVNGAEAGKPGSLGQTQNGP